MKFAHSNLANVGTANYNGAGTQHIVQTPEGNLYAFFIDGGGTDVCWSKSTDGGLSWSNETTLNANTAVGFAIWYDKWSGLSTGLIHIAYYESSVDDIFYRTIDTASSDSVSAEVTVAALTSTAVGGQISITRARGGNVYIRCCIDAGAEGAFYRLLNADVPTGAWASRTINEALATQDQMILVPGFAADNQDIIGIFWDASADEISRQLYDDSANSWAETSIATSMVDAAATSGWPQFSAAVDLTNSRIVLAAWSNLDLANSDLRCWTITESAITETSTNVVLNSTDDQAFCGVSIDINSGRWYVFYCGKSDGSETYATSTNIYYKFSDNAGATWSSELALTTDGYARLLLTVCPRMYNGLFPVVASQVTTGAPDTYKITVPVMNRRASYQLGL